MADKNFQIKNGLSINGQQVVDGNRNANLTSAIISGVDILSYTQAAFNQANTGGGGGDGTDQFARDTANGANGLASGAYGSANTNASNITSVNQYAAAAYGSANTNATNITSVNQYAASAYATANGANGLASGAYNQANTAVSGLSSKQDTLVSGTNIKTINGTSILGSGNIVAGGGGGPSTSNSFITVQDSTNYRNLGTPDLVEYIPSGNLIVKGPITMGSGNTSTAYSNLGNTYVDMGGFNNFSNASNPYYAWKPDSIGQPVWIAKERGVPTYIKDALLNLIPGDKIELTFAGGTTSSSLDQFTVNLELTTPVNDYSWWYQQPAWLNTTPYGGPDGPLSLNSSSYWFNDVGGTGLVFFAKNIVIQPTYNSTSNTTTTTLVGSATNLAINSNFITNSAGKGVLNLYTVFNAGGTSSYAGSQRIGAVSFKIPQRNGTVMKFTPSVYDDVLFYKTSLYSSNGQISYSSPVTYNTSNYQLIMSSANLVGQVTTSTQIQTYDALRSEQPTLKLGQNLDLWEDSYTNKMYINGDIYRNYGYKNLGKVLSTSTSNGFANVNSYVVGMYSSYTNKRYMSTNVPKNSFYWNRQQGDATTNGAFWLLNVDDQVYNALKANGSTFYITYTNANTTPINVSFKTVSNGANGVIYNSNQLYNYSFGYFGIQNNWIRMALTKYITGNTNTAFSSYSTLDYDPRYQNAVIHYPTDVVTITTDSNTINNIISNTSQLYIANVSLNVQSINTGSNTLITYLPAKPYANVILTNAPITTYTQSGKLATVTDIANNLPTWLKRLDGQVNYDTNINQSAYKLKMYQLNGQWVPYFATETIQDLASLSPVISSDFQFASATDSKWLDKDAGYWNTAAVYIAGGLGVAKGIWAKGLWANTSIKSPSATITALTASNTVSGNISSNYITVPKVYTAVGDPYYANTTLLLLGNYSGGSIKDDSFANATITMQGSAGALTTSADVPSGATGQSVVLPASTWFSVSNPNAKSLGSADWTVESWVKTEWFYWGYEFVRTFDDLVIVNAQWPYYPYIYVNGTGELNGPFAQQVYDAFTNPANQWNHWAWVKSGSLFSLYINGSLVSASVGSGSSFDTSAQSFKIGYPNGFSVYNTYFYNFRITVGHARYNSNFDTTSSAFLSPYSTTTTDIIQAPNPGSVDLYGGIQFHNLNSAPSNTALQGVVGGGYLYTANNKLYYMGPNTTTLLANS